MKLTNRVLHKRAKPVDFRYPSQNHTLAAQMHKIMHLEQGIGLSAPQIGISKRVLVMDIDGWQRSCFNPEIVAHSDQLIQSNEGCLSFPGKQCIIQRHSWVEIRYQDPEGQWYQEKIHDLAARCFQHELDHLNGVTMWDRNKEQNAKQS
jgi:peptide deformylase